MEIKTSFEAIFPGNKIMKEFPRTRYIKGGEHLMPVVNKYKLKYGIFHMKTLSKNL